MAWHEFLRRLAHFTRRSRFDREIEAEIQSHIEARADELVDAGVPHRDALAQARREFGSPIRARESAQEAWRFRWLEELRADLRYAVRAFRRSPAFTLTAVTSLALGIGASSAMFAALDAILWKPLPVSDPSSLVRLSLTRASAGETQQIPHEYAELLRGSGVFADVILTSGDGLSFTYDGRAERIVGASVSPNFFKALGLQPILGRGFSPDLQDGHWAAEAVLSYSFWQQRFGGDPTVVGRTIHLNTCPFTIVGVSPKGFLDLERGFDPELRIPIMPFGQVLKEIDQVSGAPTRRMALTARLKPATTAAQAEAAADVQFQTWLGSTTLAAMRRAQYRHVILRSAKAGLDGGLEAFRSPILVLLTLVALVLLIACANVANMLLARGIARHRELALRASIGAGRVRLVRQLLTESVVLALAGGMLGVGIAYWVSDALAWFLPQGHIALVIDLRPDGRVLAFTAALSILSGMVFGLVPAFQATRRDLTTGLKADGAGAAHNSRVRSALVLAQVALSLVLLIVAGWFMRTVSNLRPADFRVPADRVLLFTMKPQREIYDADRMRRLVADLHQRMRVLPEVRSAAFAEFGPLGSRSDYVTYEAQDAAAVHGALDLVSPGFFETIGLPIVAGRDFGPGDTQSAPPAIIVNEAMSRALFRGANPLGRSLRVVGDPQRRTLTVVGVAATAHYYDLHGVPAPAAWISWMLEPPYMPTLHVRAASADVSAVVAAVRREFDAVDKGFPIFNIKTLEARVDDSLSRERMIANVSMTFGALALILAGVGLSGVLTYSVSRRQREIGIRLALGSSHRRVLGLVIREAATLVLGGAVAGIAIATLARQLAAPYLYGVPRFDSAVFFASAAALFLIALAAVSVPAARATRVNPVVALRSE